MASSCGLASDAPDSPIRGRTLPVTALGSPIVADLSDRLVDALHTMYGTHPGHRAAHAKGMLCAATFTATPAAAELSRAEHLQGARLRAHVRFSNGNGDPGVPDGTRDGRGVAVKVYLPAGGTT